MQETRDRTGELHQEFFEGKHGKTMFKEMDNRLAELKAQGHTFVRRVKIGRNERCPCGSGRKFKRCCTHKVRK